MTDLNALIERLSSAMEGSREFDALIECEVRKLQAYALGLNDKARSHWNPLGSKGEVICSQGTTRYHAPMYSTSIDAAMTLTDPQSHLTIDRYVVSDKPNQMTWRVWIKKLVGDVDGDGPCGLQTTFATGPTVPLALCIAALKARIRSPQP